ncbi:hypothetical protein DOE76_10620 [Leifsonia sp. ku-ls]|nr:hypothetical protein DOE76_10620 [Leifsonia sp. ku-ls]
MLTVTYRVLQTDVDTGTVTATGTATSPQVAQPTVDTAIVTVVVRPAPVDPSPEGPGAVPQPGAGAPPNGADGSSPAPRPSRDALARTGTDVKNGWSLAATLIPLGTALLLIRGYGGRRVRRTVDRG